MEAYVLIVNLSEEKGRLKQKFASLTDDDLLFEEGKREEMFGRNQLRLGSTENEYDKFIPML